MIWPYDPEKIGQILGVPLDCDDNIGLIPKILFDSSQKSSWLNKMEVSWVMGVPQNGWFAMEHPLFNYNIAYL